MADVIIMWQRDFTDIQEEYDFVLFNFDLFLFLFDLRHQHMSVFVSLKRVWAYSLFSVLARDDMDKVLIWILVFLDLFIIFNSFILPTFISTDWWTRSSSWLGRPALSELCWLQTGGLGYFCFLSVCTSGMCNRVLRTRTVPAMQYYCSMFDWTILLRINLTLGHF